MVLFCDNKKVYKVNSENIDSNEKVANERVTPIASCYFLSKVWV
jgi:hypothetical protein